MRSSQPEVRGHDACGVVRQPGTGQPDARVHVSDACGQVAGSCALWWHATPRYLRTRVGAIGSYAAADHQAAYRLLERACRELAAVGCGMAIGPMDRDTWHDYRVVVEEGVEPRYFMEPGHPAEYARHFRENGFAPLAHYFSALDERLARPDPLADEAARQLRRRGVRTRPLRLPDLDAELGRIYSVATVSFQDHLLYSTIDEQEFRAMYGGLSPWVRPEFVIMAEHEGLPVGFAFGLPDRMPEGSGAASTTLIIKTVAVLPDRRYMGLSYWLLKELRCSAAQAGFTRAIYALMRDTGYLRRRVTQFATPMRRYALFAKELRR